MHLRPPRPGHYKFLEEVKQERELTVKQTKASDNRRVGRLYSGNSKSKDDDKDDEGEDEGEGETSTLAPPVPVPIRLIMNGRPVYSNGRDYLSFIPKSLTGGNDRDTWIIGNDPGVGKCFSISISISIYVYLCLVSAFSCLPSAPISSLTILCTFILPFYHSYHYHYRYHTRQRVCFSEARIPFLEPHRYRMALEPIRGVDTAG